MDEESIDQKLASFKQMVVDHDLTYIYSDDHQEYMKGQSSEGRIALAARDLPREAAVEIWNEQVDKKLLPGFREGWYWK